MDEKIVRSAVCDVVVLRAKCEIVFSVGVVVYDITLAFHVHVRQLSEQPSGVSSA